MISNSYSQQGSTFQERNNNKVDFVETGVALIVEITIVIMKMNVFMMRMKMMMMTAIIVIVILMLKMLPIVILVIMMMIDNSGDNVILHSFFNFVYRNIIFETNLGFLSSVKCKGFL